LEAAQTVNQATGHLTDAQIENYVNQDGAASNPEEQRLRFEAHLADCESCVDRVLHAERKHLGLLEGDHMRETPYPGCPAEETLQELAAGIGSPETAEATTEHAAHCDFCGPVLNRYLKEFSESVEQEDAAILKNLETSKTAWQKKFVRENFAVAKKESKRALFSGFWPKLVAVPALAAVAVGVYFVVRPADDLQKAQKLVASAYSERRTTEMRFPSAPFANFSPVPVVRGPDDNRDWTAEPQPLLEAESILAKRLRSGNVDPQWLEVQGRIQLLEAKTDSAKKAVDAFEKAVAADPGNVELKIDLAAASFEEATRTAPDQPVLTKTIDLLNQVLKNPNTEKQQRATALFDLAIAYQKSNMLDLAVNTWEEYLKLDSDSQWANEARSWLQKAKDKIPDPKLQSYVRSRDPLFF